MIAPTDAPALPPDDAHGLTLSEVCEALGLSAKNLARTAKTAGYADRDAYLAGVHGVRCIGKKGKAAVYTRDARP